jgi:TetR/AcrR family transcriptional repressor of nem operon
MTPMSRPAQRTGDDTATRILDVAQKLMQRRGFNNISYADIAAELRITTASLHYHYAGKAALGSAVVGRYSRRFIEALGEIEARDPDAMARLEAYVDLYASVLRDRRLCLCGVLAAEYNTLPKPMREAVIHFFDANEAWLARVLQAGRDQGSIRLAGSPEDEARMVIGGLEGAMLVARPYGDVARFRSAARQLLLTLAPNEPIAV